MAFMPVRSLFVTQIYHAPLKAPDIRGLNTRLLREIHQLRIDDESGRRWSARNYPGGFTSYGSSSRLQQVSPTFAALERHLAPHVRRFCRQLELDLTGRTLAMTDCWANIMARGATHGLHLHPLCTISGTYYIQIPKQSSGLKFEDPRLERMMAAPPRRTDCRPEHKPWVVFNAKAGDVILFESWLRHEVPPNIGDRERVSVSFNYSWF